MTYYFGTRCWNRLNRHEPEEVSSDTYTARENTDHGVRGRVVRDDVTWCQQKTV